VSRPVPAKAWDPGEAPAFLSAPLFHVEQGSAGARHGMYRGRPSFTWNTHPAESRRHVPAPDGHAVLGRTVASVAGRGRAAGAALAVQTRRCSVPTCVLSGRPASGPWGRDVPRGTHPCVSVVPGRVRRRSKHWRRVPRGTRPRRAGFVVAGASTRRVRQPTRWRRRRTQRHARLRGADGTLIGPAIAPTDRIVHVGWGPTVVRHGSPGGDSPRRAGVGSAASPCPRVPRGTRATSAARIRSALERPGLTGPRRPESMCRWPVVRLELAPIGRRSPSPSRTTSAFSLPGRSRPGIDGWEHRR
jgi:hypothetical protein